MEYISELFLKIEQKKQELLICKLKELNIEFDPKIEQLRRFKKLAREIRGNEETIYYNDGSIDGLRVITFKTIMEPFNHQNFSVECNVSYY